MVADDVPGPVTEIRNIHGIPTIFMNGEPFTEPVFETYVPQVKYFKQFAEAGVNVHMFSLSLGPCMQIAGGRAAPIWIAPDKWDFEQLDRRAHNVLEADPDAMLFPRFYIDTPDWWLSHNVSECMVLDTGKNYYIAPTNNAVTTNHLFASLASEKWRQDMAYGIKQVIKHIQESDYADKIFAYQITGLYTEEFYHWSSKANQLADYSEPFVKRFRAFLEKKYGCNKALQDAWRQPKVTFETAEVPNKEHRVKGRNERTFRNLKEDMPVVDFYLYYNEVMPEVIEHFCRAAKEACESKKIVGSFYGFMFEFGGDPEFGHNALNRYLQSDDIDFIVVTASYWNRKLGSGADYTRSPATSVLLNDKLWYHDNDTLSFLYREAMGWRDDMTDEEKAFIEKEARRIGAPTTLNETIWQYERTAGFSLAWGFYQGFFDLHGGYFDHPLLMKEIADLTEILSESRNYDRSSVAEILVISDEQSPVYATYDSQMVSRSLSGPQVVFTKIGAPHDSILVNDLDKVDPSRYKFVIFLNTFHLTEQQRQWAKRLMGDGRTVLWTYAPGLFNGPHKNVDAMHKLTGICIQPSDDEKQVNIGAEIQSDSSLGTLLKSQGVEYFGIGADLARLFYVNDNEAEKVGIQPGTKKVTFALKQLSDCVSVYSVTPLMPVEAYRELAKQAGVHLYNTSNDTLYVNKSYLTVNADGAGTRTIVFPEATNVFDPVSGKLLYQDITDFKKVFKDKETLLVRISQSKKGNN
jgi:hypothetical protein